MSEASSQGKDDIVQYLIDLGADPNARNEMGRSPLFRASFNGHLTTVKLLLSVGGDPDLNTKDAEVNFFFLLFFLLLLFLGVGNPKIGKKRKKDCL